MGGKIFARSRVGYGTTFTVELPLEVDEIIQNSTAPSLMPSAVEVEAKARKPLDFLARKFKGLNKKKPQQKTPLKEDHLKQGLSFDMEKKRA